MSTLDYVVIGFSLVLTLLNIVNMVTVLKTKASEPHKDLENRVSNLEKEVSKLDERIFDEDKKIQDLESATKMLLESTRALLSNMISENPEEIKAAYKNLNDFLVNR